MADAATVSDREHTKDRPLADSELDACTGGSKRQGSGSFFEAPAHALSNALHKQAATIQ